MDAQSDERTNTADMPDEIASAWSAVLIDLCDRNISKDNVIVDHESASGNLCKCRGSPRSDQHSANGMVAEDH